MLNVKEAEDDALQGVEVKEGWNSAVDSANNEHERRLAILKQPVLAYAAPLERIVRRRSRDRTVSLLQDLLDGGGDSDNEGGDEEKDVGEERR